MAAIRGGKLNSDMKGENSSSTIRKASLAARETAIVSNASPRENYEERTFLYGRKLQSDLLAHRLKLRLLPLCTERSQESLLERF